MTIGARRVPLVGVEFGWASTRTTDSSANRRNVVHEWDKHDDIRHIRSSQDWGGQRSPVPVCDQVVLRAGSSAIRGVRTGHRPAPFCWRLSRIDHRAGPVEFSGAVESYEQDLKHLVEHSRTLPLTKTIPAGHPATAQLAWHVLPRDAGAQNEHNACKGRSVGSTRTPAPLTGRVPRQNRLKDRPQPIVDQTPCHSVFTARIMPNIRSARLVDGIFRRS